MKNMIKYYYNIDDLNSCGRDSNMFLDNNRSIYVLENVYNKNEIYEIYKLISNDSNFYKILRNINNDIITNIYGIDYILLKKTNSRVLLDESLINNRKEIQGNTLERANWVKLWSDKIDYYEYQLNHIIGNYKLIEESFNYYIGLSENAISYLKYNLTESSSALFLSHRRIDEENYYNPLNLIVDYKARDVSGYLKFLFLNEKHHDFDLLSFFYKLNFNYNDYIMLFARMLFPSFYFDLYDRIVNNQEDQNIIIEVLKRADEYEDYLKIIYIEINKIVKIPALDWL